MNDIKLEFETEDNPPFKTESTIESVVEDQSSSWNFAQNFESQVEESQLKKLICTKFGFNDIIYKRVADNDFDIESLFVATESEINDLFPAPLLGTRAKFKFHLKLWRNETSSAHRTSSLCREWINLNTPSSFDYTPPTPSSSRKIDRNDVVINNISLIELLNKTKQGVQLLNLYAEEQCLDDLHRDILTSIIVDSYTNDRKQMSVADVANATSAIQAIFPTENQAYYLLKRGHGLNPTGKLHDKAANARIKLKKLRKRQSLASFEVTSNESSTSKAPTAVVLSRTDEEEEAIQWLTHNSEPWSDVEKYWIRVLHVRQNDVKTDGENVSKKWPLFKHSSGFELIDIDYKTIRSENPSQLFQLWPMFVNKILPYFKMHIKDKSSLSLVRKLADNLDENSRDCIFAMLFHAIVKPTVLPVGKDAKKTRWKPSISDSQESCILHSISINHYMEKVEALKAKYYEKGFTLQPIIIVIGEDKFALKHFYTYYDGILYKFDSFLKCFDITFKLFHVMNLEYPKVGRKVYNFIENFFYNFNTELNSNVLSVLDYLNK